MHVWLRSLPTRVEASEHRATVRFSPVEFDPKGFAPLRLAGAWTIEVGDPRFGGISALAIDQGRLLMLTDSGSLAWLPRPGDPGSAVVRDLPAGPGKSSYKSNRDSEALARDAQGRGWWVAFERWNQLWLYDSRFKRQLAKVDLGADRWPDNRGIEGLVATKKELMLFPELGDEWLGVNVNRIDRRGLTNNFGHVSDAWRLGDGRLLLVTRQITIGGLAKRLVEANPSAGGGQLLRELAPLPIGATDNIEGITAEPRADGGTRLWLVTDNDFRPRKATLLLAIDLP